MKSKYEQGQIYESRNCGKFELIKKEDKGKWKVMFLASGYETSAYQCNIRTGRVLDMTIKNAIGKYKIGQKITKHNGEVVEIIDIGKKREANGRLRTILTVKFLENGFITKCTPDNLYKERRVRNLYKPTIRGIGCLGDIDDILNKFGKISDCEEYRLWDYIIDRCYQKDYSNENKSYKDAVICDRWKRFDYFYEDIQNVEGYELWKNFKENNPNKKCIYELDKDTKKIGNKIYSPETVRFIHKKFNAGFTSWASNEVKEKILKDMEDYIVV